MTSPKKSIRLTRSSVLLQTLLSGPGTLHQICERANIEIETVVQATTVRHLFESLIQSGSAGIDSITYSITPSARARLSPVAAVAVGSMATPHYRGPRQVMPVTIYRRRVAA